MEIGAIWTLFGLFFLGMLKNTFPGGGLICLNILVYINLSRVIV